ncbi:MAG TPA: xanthine dehydrogenase family protein subunit M [Thermoanaerobaculia bacterium]|nr:xanthine dehydrogenase family protein subunit M [Thermoanaerobaculia bacterium]
MSAAAAPRTLDAAVAALAADPSLVPIAGCTDLMVADPLRRLGMDRVLDLTRIPELAGIREKDGAIEIGAATTFRALGDSPLVRERFPALAQAARVVGGWQIQNRATLGGNVANASPAGDALPVLLALDAELVIAGAGGTRTLPYGEFHVGYRKTALRVGEILTRVRLPRPATGSAQAFRKVGTREAQAISKVVVAMAAKVEDGALSDLRLAAGSVAPTPLRLRAAEEAAAGRPLGAQTAERVARVAAGEVEPIDDVRSTADYRRFALERVVRRMLLELGTRR